MTDLNYLDTVLNFYDPTLGLPHDTKHGDRFVSASNKGEWHMHAIMQFDGKENKWIEYIPKVNDTVWMEYLNKSFLFNGNKWELIGKPDPEPKYVNIHDGEDDEDEDEKSVSDGSDDEDDVPHIVPQLHEHKQQMCGICGILINDDLKEIKIAGEFQCHHCYFWLNYGEECRRECDGTYGITIAEYVELYNKEHDVMHCTHAGTCFLCDYKNKKIIKNIKNPELIYSKEEYEQPKEQSNVAPSDQMVIDI